ncbi:MAG: pyridoxamine 5'-phosphate oxidase family protein [Dehalococcoidia bacterium]|nr:pyridoxamine 5'-phosphate oxidase family protein [Dehalococcoidia bacterium]
MRRKHSEVTDMQEIERILSATNIGRMATSGSDGYPYVTPVNFVFHEGNIYFHCAPLGEKLDNVARDPHVCFEVDIPLAYLDASFEPDRRGCRLHQFYHCVIIRGEASILPNGPVKTAALNALVAKHEPGAAMEPLTEDLPGYAGCNVVQIRPVTMSAKSDLHQNKTPEVLLSLARHLKRGSEPAALDTIRAMGFNPDDL